jgi:peptidoglycan-N-acetylglucosamine deacetylase
MSWTSDVERGNFHAMSVTRGNFLKQLGKSLPGMVLGGGVATAARTFLGKMAAVSGAMENPASAVGEKPAILDEAKVKFITSGRSSRNQIALTFDDGPTPGVTDLILDELKRRKLRATFFMIGERIAAMPDLARRVLAEGHEVGNHTFTHPKLTTLPDAEVQAEIQKTQDLMRNVMNHRPVWFRPPFGALRQNQAPMLAKQGLGIVFWSVDPQDWSQPGPAKITAKILADTKPGSIIVCHDLHAQTSASLSATLDGLFDRAFSLVTLSELLE